MADFVSPLLQWLHANPQYAGLATFLISAGESVAVIGTLVPGSITMTAIGALAGAGIIPLYETIFWAILGAIVGDGISYWMGYYFKDRLNTIWPFKNYPGLLESGQRFVDKYGYMSVFIGRFVGPVRAIVPVIAGMLGMAPWKFTLANVTSAIGWAPAYMLPGILLGAASLELPPDIALHVVLVLLLISLFVILCLWFLYKLTQWVVYHTTQIQIEIWDWLKSSRYLHFLTQILTHHNEKKIRFQVALGFYTLDALILFFLVVLFVKVNGASHIMINDAVYHLFRSIREPTLDKWFLYFTFLGQKEILIPVAVILSGWLYYIKRPRASCHILATIFLYSGTVYVLKHVLAETRPWGIYLSPSSYSMPSGHAAAAVTFYMGISFLIALGVKPIYRWIVYSGGILLALAVSISRLYLGAHWFTDILGGWLIASAVLMVIIISYNRKEERSANPWWILLITSVLITLGVTIFAHFKYEKSIISYSSLAYPTINISMPAYWQSEIALPAYHVSLFGFPSQGINIQWVGDLAEIEATLRGEGWVSPPKRDFISVLHRIADIKSNEYLSLISPQYLDRIPALTLVRQVNGNKSLIALRLWFANRLVGEDKKPLWVGVVGVIPRSYSWLTQSHPGHIVINSKAVFPQQSALNSWQLKMIEVKIHRSSQKILLIKSKHAK